MDNKQYTADDWKLLSAAESRIDTAMAKLITKTEEMADATGTQAAAVEELREVRNAIRAVRDRLGKDR